MMKTSRLEFKGSCASAAKWKRALNYEFDKVTVVFNHEYEGPECDDLCHVVVEVTPYHPDEQMDRDMYGDPEWDHYTMTDSYREDCYQEQWDWLKNE